MASLCAFRIIIYKTHNVYTKFSNKKSPIFRLPSRKPFMHDIYVYLHMRERSKFSLQRRRRKHIIMQRILLARIWVVGSSVHTGWPITILLRTFIYVLDTRIVYRGLYIIPKVSLTIFWVYSIRMSLGDDFITFQRIIGLLNDVHSHVQRCIERLPNSNKNDRIFRKRLGFEKHNETIEFDLAS